MLRFVNIDVKPHWSYQTLENLRKFSLASVIHVPIYPLSLSAWLWLRPHWRHLWQQSGYWWRRPPEQPGQLSLRAQCQPGWPWQGWQRRCLRPWRWQRWHSWRPGQLQAGAQSWPEGLWRWVTGASYKESNWSHGCLDWGNKNKAEYIWGWRD